MFGSIKSKFAALFTALMLALAAPAAFASAPAAVDVTGVVSAIEAAATPIGAIGAAVLLILVAIKVYKWVRRAM